MVLKALINDNDNDNNNNNKILKVEVIITIIMRFLKVWINDDNNNDK